MKIIKYLIESLFIYIFFIIIKMIGLNLSRKVFSFIFRIIGPLIKSKKLISTNISKAFLNISKKDEKAIISSMWSNYGMVFVEYIFLNKFKKENFHIEIKGKEILTELKRKNKPVIFVSGHFANFELMSMELTKANINLATIYRPLNNIFLNPFMEYLRKKYICSNQIKKGIRGIRHSIEYLNNKYSVALMIDQRVTEGSSVPFFNTNASTTTLPAQLAIKYDCEIVPIFIDRKKNNSFHMEIHKPINFSDIKNNSDKKIEITLHLNKIIEKMVLRNPGNWIWSHNRWK
jgi:Kdo2-lipid IVA lauroyltransferase/acyltransferase